jgi:MSHA biogenesis protein MshO
MTRAVRGFTLMETVLVIVVLGIVGVSLGMFILPAVNSQQAMENRAALVDSAETALRRMARDIRVALPNSLRVTNAGGFTLEMIPTVDGGRYCNGDADCNNSLTIGAADTVFDILGCFRNGTFTAAPGSPYRLVIGDSSGSAYAGAAVITPTSTSIALSIWPGTGATPAVCGSASATANSYNRHRVTLSAAQTFPSASPRRRVFVVSTAVAYVCSTAGQTLTRYSGYAIGALPTTGTAALVTDKVTACSVTSTTGQVQATGLVTLRVTLATASESVTLMHQAQLDNSQ